VQEASWKLLSYKGCWGGPGKNPALELLPEREDHVGIKKSSEGERGFIFRKGGSQARKGGGRQLLTRTERQPGKGIHKGRPSESL